MFNFSVDFKKKELIVRKKKASFLEKIFRYLGYDFRHDIYKQIIYCEASVMTPLEQKIKNYYDAYSYLLQNSQNPLTKEILSRFFYIIDETIPNEIWIRRLCTRYFDYVDLPPIEQAIEFHLKAYKLMDEFEGEKRFIVSLMLFNYLLVKNNIPIIRILNEDLKKYETAKGLYYEGEKQKIYELFLEIISESKFQDKEYYKNLKPLSLEQIYKKVMEDKKMLERQYNVKHISIFGSFAKNKERIDSDIDMLVTFSLDLTDEKKKENIEYLTNYFFNKFYRFIDIMEAGICFNDELIREISGLKKIY